jgi:hypothetical protein
MIHNEFKAPFIYLKFDRKIFQGSPTLYCRRMCKGSSSGITIFNPYVPSYQVVGCRGYSLE